MYDTHKDKSDAGIRKNVGGKYPTKLNKFGMKTKKQVRYPMVAYNRGDKAKMRLAGDVPDYTGKAGN